jgi:O-antigen biosynthesis protein
LGRGLTPWRRRGTRGFSVPWPRRFTIWSERWQAPEDRLRALEALLRAQGAHVRRGGDFDRWDLELRAGMLGAVRIDLVVEEHGRGQQLVRFRAWPRATGMGLMLIALLGIVSIIDASVAAWQGALICGIPAWLLALRAAQECAAGMAAVKAALTGDEARRNKAETLLRKVKPSILGVPISPMTPPDSRLRSYSPPPADRDHVPLDAELAHEG